MEYNFFLRENKRKSELGPFTNFDVDSYHILNISTTQISPKIPANVRFVGPTIHYKITNLVLTSISLNLSFTINTSSANNPHQN